MKFSAPDGVPATASAIESLRTPLKKFCAAALWQYIKLDQPLHRRMDYAPITWPGYTAGEQAGLDTRRFSTLLDKDAANIDGYGDVVKAVSASAGLRDYFCRDVGGKVPDVIEGAILSHRLIKVVTAVSDACGGFDGDEGANFTRGFDQAFQRLGDELASPKIARRIIALLTSTCTTGSYAISKQSMIRPVSIDERNELIARLHWLAPTAGVTIDDTLNRLIYAECAIETAIEGPRSLEMPIDTAEAERVQDAVRLGAGIHCSPVMTFIYVDSIGFGYGVAYSKNAEPNRLGAAETLDAAGADRAREVFELMETSPNFKRTQLAIRRLGLGSGRLRSEDAFIDHIVAIESLVTENPGDLTYKLSMRLATMIGASPNEKIEIRRRMQSHYGDRSKVLHGKYTGDLDKAATEVREFARRLIVAVLNTVEPWTESVVDKRMLGVTPGGVQR